MWSCQQYQFLDFRSAIRLWTKQSCLLPLSIVECDFIAPPVTLCFEKGVLHEKELISSIPSNMSQKIQSSLLSRIVGVFCGDRFVDYGQSFSFPYWDPVPTFRRNSYTGNNNVMAVENEGSLVVLSFVPMISPYAPKS